MFLFIPRKKTPNEKYVESLAEFITVSKAKNFRWRELLHLIVVFAVISVTTAFSQESEYTIKGRVLGDDGKPMANRGVLFFPRFAKLGGVLSWDDLNENGEFLTRKKAPKGGTWDLYIIDTIPGSVNTFSFIEPPFSSYLGRYDKNFLGYPVEFGSKKVIDLGDVRVKFRYGDVNLRFLINGRKLSKSEWETLWVAVNHKSGRRVGEISIGPDALRSNKVDLEKSELKLSLPEGTWQVALMRFDDLAVNIYSKGITAASSPYFTIRKEKTLQTINLIPAH